MAQRSASKLLRLMVRRVRTDQVTLEDITQSLSERGFGILLVLFVIPLCIPVPAPPGVASIFAVPVLFISLQMVLGLQSPWMPNWLKKKAFSRKTVAYMVEKSAPILRKIERVLRPRFSFASTKTGERFIGTYIFIIAAVIAIPVPLPFSNLIPGIGILIMSLGLLGRDGIAVLLGMLVGLLGATFVITALVLGVKFVKGIIEQFMF